MSVSGLCEICNAPDVDHSCERCGQLVCDDHYDTELAMCIECGAEVGRPDDGPAYRDEDLPDGVDTYRF